ncbi:MAG: SynChlorMet cassette radical SAM/SPASM protein ScmE [Proteobacteria bacterium]|nr:SynChlorMet cassette radical SAM/SPASM protein ScmE [Pseudomonadota bacterium]
MKLMNTPKTLDLSITNLCNLRCSYCYHFGSEGDAGKDLPASAWLEFFEELNDCAVLNVTIAGGEPFIRKDLKTLIRGVVDNRMRFSILTNGTLVTDEMAEFIASTGRCDSIQVSLDGSSANAHDVFRGKGTFQKALDGLAILRKNGISVTVRVTIHRHNVSDLEEIAKLLLEEVGLPAFSTNAASHAGLCREYADEVQLTADDRSRAMATLLKLNKKYGGRIGAQAGPLAEARNWLKIKSAREEGKTELPGRGRLRSCGGVFQKMAVRADGIMTPCSQIPHVELGRINQDDLKDVWRNHSEMIRLRKRRNIPLGDFEFCRGCEFVSYCAGGCPALAHTITGDANKPSPDACLKQFIEDGGVLPDSMQ